MLTAGFYEVLAAGGGCLFVVMIGAAITLKKYEKRKWYDSFINRTVKTDNKLPLSLEKVLKIATKPFIPDDSKLSETKKLLVGSGNEATEPESVYMFGLMLSVILSIITFSMMLLTPLPKWVAITAVIIAMALGNRLPTMVLDVLYTRKSLEKQAGVLKFAESITSAVEAGITLYQAISKVSSKQKTPLALEFSKAIEETETNAKSFDEALYGIIDRVGGDNIKLLVEGIINSKKSGSSVTNVLYALCNTIRNETKTTVKNTVEKAKLKNLLLQFTLQFPAYAYILAGPALIGMLQAL